LAESPLDVENRLLLLTGVTDCLDQSTHKAAGAKPAAFYLSIKANDYTHIRNGKTIMLHPYKHQLLHKSDSRERLKQAENDRLVRLVSHPTTQLQSTVELSGLISKWWSERWNNLRVNQRTASKIVIPEVEW
jgi:hypothetical protein